MFRKFERVITKQDKSEVRQMYVAGLGRLTADVEVKKVTVGNEEKSVVKSPNPSIAFNMWDSQKKESKTVFMRVEAWGPTAEYLAKIGVKGAELFVTGKFETRTNSSNGKDYTNDYLIVESVSETAETARKRTGGNSSTNTGENPAVDNEPGMNEGFTPVEGDEEDDDLPF